LTSGFYTVFFSTHLPGADPGGPGREIRVPAFFLEMIMAPKTQACRDRAALESLAAAAGGASPHRVERVAADLAAEIDLAEADAARFAADGNTSAAKTATSIAAAISKIHRLLPSADDAEKGETT